jgi:nucleoside-diphosphate-sugar epimerase
MWMSQRVLVLGGNRYIGMRLLFELAARGHDVTVLNSHVADMPDGTRRLHGDRQQAAYRDSYGWWQTEGRDRYEYDFTADDQLARELRP